MLELGWAQPSALILAGIIESAGSLRAMASGSPSTASQGDSGLDAALQHIRKAV